MFPLSSIGREADPQEASQTCARLAGLVRALRGHEGNEGTARGWAQGGLAKEYRAILLGKGVELVVEGKVKRRGMKKERNLRTGVG